MLSSSFIRSAARTSHSASCTASLRSMSSASYIALQPSGAPAEGSAAPSAVSSTVEKLWAGANTNNKPGVSRTFYGVDGKTVVALSVPPKPAASGEEGDNSLRETARKTAALATHALKAANANQFEVDPLYSAHAAATGATLASFAFNLKSTTAAKKELEPVQLALLGDKAAPSLESEKAKDGRIQLDWDTGLVYGQAQNLARELMELPANKMTPTIFCDRAAKEFEGIANVTMEAHDLAWAEEKKMGAFISVNRGSSDHEPLRFLELHYKGAANKDEAPIAFVGKGITFDSGGISLKPGKGMKDMRADMGGAATTLAATWAIAKLKIPINLVLCIPLTENMPSGKATKPGDVVTASNGVTIEVDNTDAEGRLALSDALYYASSTFKPSTIIDAATLTGAMCVALGAAYTGAYSNSDALYAELEAAGQAEADQFWRMPLSEEYAWHITGSNADLCNINHAGAGLAGSSTAALFLKRFVDGLIVDGEEPEDKTGLTRWAHLDIAGVMDCWGSNPYKLPGGAMTGRPVRTLIEFARRSAKA